MWRGHGGGDGAVLGARSAHCSAEKGVMSGVFGPSSSRTVAVGWARAGLRPAAAQHADPGKLEEGLKHCGLCQYM